jgi:hypothetical protein
MKLLGGYQRENLNVALEALDVLRQSLEIPHERARERGWSKPPGRGASKSCTREPYVMVLDGAHNPAREPEPSVDDLRRYRAKICTITKSALLFRRPQGESVSDDGGDTLPRLRRDRFREAGLTRAPSTRLYCAASWPPAA